MKERGKRKPLNELIKGHPPLKIYVKENKN